MQTHSIPSRNAAPEATPEDVAGAEEGTALPAGTSPTHDETPVPQ
jgi:hypothetical protein